MVKKILIVEDNPMNMELILDLLEFYGHNVTEAEDGIKALECLADERFEDVYKRQEKSSKKNIYWELIIYSEEYPLKKSSNGESLCSN